MSEAPEATPHNLAPDLASFSREALVALAREQFELIEALRHKVAALTHELDKHRRWRFGKRSEKLTGKAANTEGAASPGVEATPAPPRPKPRRGKPHGRGRLPEHLPRVPIQHELPEPDRVCAGCRELMKQIGVETAEQLDILPPKLQVLQHIRTKLACPHCQDQVVMAPMPEQAVPKCMASPNLLAYLVTSKYADHLPLNRLTVILKRYGVVLRRSTLGGWVSATADAMEILYKLLKQDVLASRYLRADDTRVPFLDPPRDRTSTGHLWAYLGDREHMHVVFDFSPDWKNIWPLRFLEGYEGYLQADAYKGWDAVFARSALVLEVACMAHSRRLWFEAQGTDPTLALQATARIRQLYDIEDEVREMTPTGRHHVRQLKAAPVLAELRTWLDGIAGTFLPKSPTGQAWTYMNNQWSALVRYLEDGELEIDNNAAERALRPIAVGRANWTFAGSEEGGRRAAILYSFVESCKRNGIDPLKYFADVLTRLPSHPRDQLRDLLPRFWKPRETEETAPVAIPTSA